MTEIKLELFFLFRMIGGCWSSLSVGTKVSSDVEISAVYWIYFVIKTIASGDIRFLVSENDKDWS